ncbi:MAG: tyrosine-type recombinase/integrase, partial [Clostridium sp.]
MNFREILEKDYSEMLNLKESLGYSRITYKPHIEEFISYCSENYPQSSTITKIIFDKWLSTKHFKTNATHTSAISRIRSFLRFQVAIGKEAFIPGQEYSVKKIRYAPYILSDDEIKKLFQAFDTLTPHFEAPKREFIVPVLFRIMYCCGMRPSEPLNLLCEDINLETGDIYIRESKGKKDRHIIMSKELISICKQYDSILGNRKYFFERWDCGKFPTHWMTNQFHICWYNSGLIKKGNPRPYDLRHNFATRTLTRWVDESKDCMGLLPYLSEYMGHTCISNTLYYVHLLPERLRNSVGIDWDKFSEIYPEVLNE